jgi:hypothetical protein
MNYIREGASKKKEKGTRESLKLITNGVRNTAVQENKEKKKKKQ